MNTKSRNSFRHLQKTRIPAVILLTTVAFISGCQTTSPLTAPYNALSNASSANTPEVALAMQQLQAFPDSRINLPGLIYSGASTDVILKVMNHYGSSAQYTDLEQINALNHYSHTPYSEGNAFQIAIAAGRPDVAEKIAIDVAQKAGDYRSGLPLGAIPSIAALANTYDKHREWNFQYSTDYYYHQQSIERANALPTETYHNPPGRALVFRFAASQHPGIDHDFRRQYETEDGSLESLIGPRTVKPTSGKVPNNKNAEVFEQFQTEKARRTLQFIQRNFGGGNLNEALPYCITRGDDIVMVCPDMTPTHLAARNTAHIDLSLRVDRFWTTAGKLTAFIAEGGNPDIKDNYGNSTKDYISHGGRHPISINNDDDVDFGQIMAGAAIVAGAGYLASEGGHSQAAEFMAGGLADVINGDTTNLMGMQQRLAAENQIQQTASGNSADNITQAQIPASTYNFTCASGTQASIPIPAGSPACISAMKKYSRAASCNLIDELKAAEKTYYSACENEIYQ